MPTYQITKQQRQRFARFWGAPSPWIPQLVNRFPISIDERKSTTMFIKAENTILIGRSPVIMKLMLSKRYKRILKYVHIVGLNPNDSVNDIRTIGTKTPPGFLGLVFLLHKDKHHKANHTYTRYDIRMDAGGEHNIDDNRAMLLMQFNPPKIQTLQVTYYRDGKRLVKRKVIRNKVKLVQVVK